MSRASNAPTWNIVVTDPETVRTTTHGPFWNEVEAHRRAARWRRRFDSYGPRRPMVTVVPVLRAVRDVLDEVWPHPNHPTSYGGK